MRKEFKVINSIEASCGKKGCRIYVLPFASTKEEFNKFVDFCVADQKEEEKSLIEFDPSDSDLDWE